MKKVNEKWFDQPHMRVTNQMLKKLKPRNSPEEALEFLYTNNIRTHIDRKVLETVRFPVDYNTPLRKFGCKVGKYELKTMKDRQGVYNLVCLESHSATPTPEQPAATTSQDTPEAVTPNPVPDIAQATSSDPDPKDSPEKPQKKSKKK